MSTNGRFVLLALAATAVACVTQAAAAPFGEASTGLRCHYRLAADAWGTSTAFVRADHVLRGTWKASSVLPSRSLFFTDESPAALRRACEAKLARTPGAGALVMIGAANDEQSYNYEIWHNGDLAPGKPVERVVSFGDSLSDTGNVYNESQWKMPSQSWYLGRFSNGPTWIEYLASRNGLTLNNWATGGAQTRDGYGGLIHGVDRQIEGFLAYMRHAKGYDPSRTLFTFLVGGNDFVNDGKTGAEIVQKQEASLRKLVAAGARRLLVVNLPDVSVAPLFRLGRTDAHTVLGRVDYYNKHIRKVVERVAADTGADVRLVDVRGRFDEVMAQPGRFGFINTTDSCLAIDTDSSLNYTRKQMSRPGCDPAAYVFWDTLHPTTRMHELMATWAAEQAPASWGLR